MNVLIQCMAFLSALLLNSCSKNNQPAPVIYKGTTIDDPAFVSQIEKPSAYPVKIPVVEEVIIEQPKPSEETIDVSQHLLEDQFTYHTVKQGETLATLATFYKLTEMIIIDLNHLQPPYRLQIGQKLKIPVGTFVSKSTASVVNHHVLKLPKSSMGSPGASVTPSATSGPILLPGEQGLSKKVNELTIKNSVPAIKKPVIKPAVPLPEVTTEKMLALPEEKPEILTEPAFNEEEEMLKKTESPEVSDTSEEQKAAAPVATASAASSPSEALPKKRFIMPIKGKTLTGFGVQSNGNQNDGINIAAPKGALVQAAADGTVAYCGNEIKGFGNLVLVNHADGWMSAYAHMDYIKVQRGQSIKAGQPVGTVGTSGDVQEAQVHFELRHHGISVDPSLQM